MNERPEMTKEESAFRRILEQTRIIERDFTEVPNDVILACNEIDSIAREQLRPFWEKERAYLRSEPAGKETK